MQVVLFNPGHWTLPGTMHASLPQIYLLYFHFGMLSEPGECLYCLGGLLYTSVMCLVVMHASFRYIAQFACLGGYEVKSKKSKACHCKHGADHKVDM